MGLPLEQALQRLCNGGGTAGQGTGADHSALLHSPLACVLTTPHDQPKLQACAEDAYCLMLYHWPVHSASAGAMGLGESVSLRGICGFARQYAR